MGFVTYILINESHTRTYVGQTGDFPSRFAKHNSGEVYSTRLFGPWIVLHKEEYTTRSEAMRREKWFKTRSGRKTIERFIQERWPSGPSRSEIGTRSRPAPSGWDS